MKGKRSADFAELIGRHGSDEIVSRDNLVLLMQVDKALAAGTPSPEMAAQVAGGELLNGVAAISLDENDSAA